jgi:hypothetical protein
MMASLASRAPLCPSSSSRGAVALIVAVVAGVLLLFVGVTVEMARMATDEQRLRAAADAAALAAAAVVKDDFHPFESTIQTAIDVAWENRIAGHPVEVSASDVEVGRWDTSASPPRFVPYDPSQVGFVADTVRVWARRDGTKSYGELPMTFGRLAGVDSVTLTEFATARRSPVGTPTLLVLDMTANRALGMNGGSMLEVREGVIQVNSSSTGHPWPALHITGTTSALSAPLTRVRGGVSAPQGTMVGNLELGVAPLPDPLAHLPYPDWNAMDVPAGPSGQIDGSRGTNPWEPGYYPNGMRLSSGGTAILAPGVYAFGSVGSNKGVDLSGGELHGQEVTLFLTPEANFKATGANVTLSAPSSGVYEGVTVFHHRQNAGGQVCQVVGQGQFAASGMMYAAGAQLDIGGNPAKYMGGIIVNMLEIAGNSSLILTGEGLAPPEGEEFVYLVE